MSFDLSLNVNMGGQSLGRISLPSFPTLNISLIGEALGRISLPSLPTLNVSAQGMVAHDAPVSGNPLRIAYKGSAIDMVAASTNLDTVDAASDLLGRAVNVLNTAQDPTLVTANASGTGNTAIIAAPGASTSIYVTSLIVAVSAAGKVVLKDGTTSKVTVSSIANNSIVHKFSKYWKLAANATLNAASNITMNYDVTLEYFTGPG